MLLDPVTVIIVYYATKATLIYTHTENNTSVPLTHFSSSNF